MGSFPGLALHMDVRTVCGQDTLYGGEPEPRSPLVPLAGFICQVESIDTPLRLILRASYCSIFYGNVNPHHTHVPSPASHSQWTSDPCPVRILYTTPSPSPVPPLSRERSLSVR